MKLLQRRVVLGNFAPGALPGCGQYRFLNAQQTLDGSTVLTLLPPRDMSQINIKYDSEDWTRKATR